LSRVTAWLEHRINCLRGDLIADQRPVGEQFDVQPHEEVPALLIAS